MKPSEIEALVEKLRPRLFQGLTPHEVKEILACGRLRQYPADAVISHEGHPADNLFLLLSGRARFFTITPNGDKALLFWAVPGDCPGGAAVLATRSDYILSAETVKPSRFLCWERASALELCRRYPRMMQNVLLIAYDYLVLYRSVHLSLACDSARQRVATVLVNLATGIGRKGPDGIELDINNEELANEAHVTHFTASRLMSEWQRNGMLIKKRGRVLLSSPERLLSQRN
jgi:CRP-like cAMP-binding protein